MGEKSTKYEEFIKLYFQIPLTPVVFYSFRRINLSSEDFEYSILKDMAEFLISYAKANNIDLNDYIICSDSIDGASLHGYLHIALESEVLKIIPGATSKKRRAFRI